MVQELKRHMVTHSGAGLFSCSVCGQTFPDRPALKAHTVSHGSVPEVFLLVVGVVEVMRDKGDWCK